MHVCGLCSMVTCSDVQSSLGSASLPEELARICNGLKSNGTVCQGFTVDSQNKRALFKGQPSNFPFDTTNDACNEPGLSFWGLNSGETLRLIRPACPRVAHCCRHTSVLTLTPRVHPVSKYPYCPYLQYPILYYASHHVILGLNLHDHIGL